MIVKALQAVNCGRCDRIIKEGEEIALHRMTMKVHCNDCREHELRITNQHRRFFLRH